MWVCGVVVEDALREGGGRGFEPYWPRNNATLLEKMHDLPVGFFPKKGFFFYLFRAFKRNYFCCF
jgi:hypothetical protein